MWTWDFLNSQKFVHAQGKRGWLTARRGLPVQGTNAHAVLCAADSTVSERDSTARQWRQQRFWYTPAPNAMLHSASVAAGGFLIRLSSQFGRCVQLKFSSDLRAPSLPALSASIRDCQALFQACLH